MGGEVGRLFNGHLGSRCTGEGFFGARTFSLEIEPADKGSSWEDDPVHTTSTGHSRWGISSRQHCSSVAAVRVTLFVQSRVTRNGGPSHMMTVLVCPFWPEWHFLPGTLQFQGATYILMPRWFLIFYLTCLDLTIIMPVGSLFFILFLGRTIILTNGPPAVKTPLCGRAQFLCCVNFVKLSSSRWLTNLPGDGMTNCLTRHKFIGILMPTRTTRNQCKMQPVST